MRYLIERSGEDECDRLEGTRREVFGFERRNGPRLTLRCSFRQCTIQQTWKLYVTNTEQYFLRLDSLEVLKVTDEQN